MTKSHTRILVWPSSLRSLDAATPTVIAGVVVGWRESRTQADIVIVAGVVRVRAVTLSNNSNERESVVASPLDLVEAVEMTRSKVRELKIKHERDVTVQKYCYNNYLNSNDYVRRVCMSDLQVIAVYLKNHPLSINASTCDLPLIIENLGAFPWWEDGVEDSVVASETAERDQQLVLYDDEVLYSSPTFHDESLLILLSHASCVMSLLLPRSDVIPSDKEEEEEEEEEITDLDSLDDRSSRFNSTQSIASAAYLSMVLSQHRFLVQAAQQSHFLRRCVYGNGLAFLRLFETRRDDHARECHPRSRTHQQQTRKCKSSLDTAGKAILCLLESRYEALCNEVDATDPYLRAVMDCLCGCVLGLCLSFMCVTYFESLHNNFFIVEAYFKYIGMGIEWLCRNPAGFKLNERLTESMNCLIRPILTLHESLFMMLLQWLAQFRFYIVLLLPVVGAIVGATGLLTLWIDLVHLGTLQLYLLSRMYRIVFRFELDLLAALWRLFRGKKRNVLRCRTDTMEYDSTQLLLGSILFAVCLLLLTTIFVYNLFFAVSYFAVDLFLLPFYYCYLIMLHLPIGKLCLRRRRSQLVTCFVTDVVLCKHAAHAYPSSSVDITSLIAIEASNWSLILESLLPPIKSMTSTLLQNGIGCFITVASASTTTKSML